MIHEWEKKKGKSTLGDFIFSILGFVFTKVVTPVCLKTFQMQIKKKKKNTH